MKELDAVVLTKDIPSERLAAGDLGTIVHVHDDNHFEVEFVESTGHTLTVVTVERTAVRPVVAGEVLHARVL